MLTQRLANIVFTILLIAACVYFAAVAQGFKAAGLLATSGLPSKFFPQLMLGFSALCALIVAVQYLLRGHAGDQVEATVYENVGEARRGLLMLFVALVCYVIWSQFGFVPMGLVLGPLSLLAMGIRSIVLYITVLVLSALIYLIFTQLLGVQLT